MNLNLRCWKLLALLLPVLSAGEVRAQENKGVQGSFVANYTTFSNDKSTVDPATWRALNKGAESHPELGQESFLAPKAGYVELYAKRTRTTRYFVNPADSRDFLLQQSAEPINYQAGGQWLGIDPRLRPAGNGKYEAGHQPVPVGVDVSSGRTYIKTVDGGIVYFNNWKLEGEEGNSRTLLAKADWSHATVGENGVYITDVFPGIDATLQVMRASVKTSFIVKKVRFGQYSKLYFTDSYSGPGVTNLHFTMNGTANGEAGSVEVGKTAGEGILRIKTGVIYAEQRPGAAKQLPYYLNGTDFSMAVSTDYLKSEMGTSGRVIIDPLVSASNSVAGETLFTMYNATCSYINSCDYAMTVVVPAATTVVDILGSHFHQFNAPCASQDLRWIISSGTCGTGTYWYWNVPANTTGFLGNGAISWYGHLQGCIPAPSCAAQSMTFNYRLFRGCVGPAGCDGSCIGGVAGYPWTMTIQGRTVETVNQNATVSATTICAGQSVTFSTGLQYGVAPYTHVWSLNPTYTPAITTSASGSQAFPTAGNYTLYYRGTDACNNTDTHMVAVLVNPIVTPSVSIAAVPAGAICAGTSVTFTATPTNGGSAPNYQWRKNGNPVGTNSTTYTDATLVNGDVITVDMTSNAPCPTTATVSSPGITMTVNPIPAITSASGVNPTTCGGSNGTVTLNGLLANSTYTINYSKNGSAQAPVSITTNASGSATITGLTIGSYSNFTATRLSCTSAVFAGPVVLSNPTAPATPVASASPNPVCTGNTLSLSTPAAANTTYTWTGPNSFTASTAAPSITGVTAAAAGTYSVIATSTVTNCPSAAGTVTVTVNPTPAITGSSSVNPATCGGTSGSITLSGLLANTAFSVAYLKGAASQTFSGTSTAGGTLTITGLTAGSYTNFVATAAGCPSNTLAGPIVLTDPAAPAVPTASSNSPVCSGNTINLFAAGPSSGVTYSWTGPSAFTSTAQNPTRPSSTTAMSGTYTVTVTDQTTLCTATSSTAVTVNQTPATPVASATPNPICSGNTLSLSTPPVAGQSYAWTGPNSFTATTAATSIANITTAATGTYSVITTNTTTNCPSAAGTVSVTVNQTPVITSVTSVNPATCGGTSGSITGNGLANNTAYSVTYLKGAASQTFSGTSNASGQLTITGLTAGSYSNFVITQTSTNCPSAPLAGPVVLTDPAPPATPTAGSNSPVCSGNAINLTAAGTTTGHTFSWTGPASYTSTAQNPTLANATTAMSGTYTVTVTNTTTLCTATSSTSVVVNQTPAAPTSASNNGPICAGQTLTFSTPAVTGGSWTWTGPNSFTSSVQNPSITNATAAATGTYSVVVKVNNCPSAPTTTSAIVNPLPVAPTVSAVSYCQFETAVPLTATGTGSLRWYTVSSGGTASTTPPTPVTTTPGTFTWYVSQVSAQNCEGPRAAIVVTIKAKPQPPVFTPSTLTYCQFVTAPNLAAAGQGILYYTTPTGGTGQAFLAPSTTMDGTFHYYASQTVNGCESDRSQVTVIVKPKPAPPLVNSPQNFCQGTGPQPLNAIGQSLAWYTVPTGGTPQFTTPLIQTVNAPDSSNWYVSQTVDGCASDRAYIQAYVNYRPTGKINGARLFVCDEDTLTLYYTGNAQNDPNVNYFWSTPMIIATPYAPTAPPYGPAITYQFHTHGPFPGSQVQLIVDNKGCQSSPFKYNVEVRELPILGFNAPGEACVDAPVTIGLNSVSLPNTDTFNWHGFDGATVIAGQNAGPYSVSWSTPGTKYLSVQGYRRGCWSDTTMDTIEIYPLPIARIDEVSDNSVCIGDTIKLRAYYDPSYSYHWSPERFFDTVLNKDATMMAHILAPSVITLTVTGPGSCTSKDTAVIDAQPCCDVFVPTAFTPNNDGLNDIFRVWTKGHHPVAAFRIVNRYGNVVFDAVNTDNGWDGTAYGVSQPVGTYFYYIKYQCATGEYFEKKGEVTLLR